MQISPPVSQLFSFSKTADVIKSDQKVPKQKQKIWKMTSIIISKRSQVQLGIQLLNYKDESVLNFDLGGIRVQFKVKAMIFCSVWKAKIQFTRNSELNLEWQKQAQEIAQVPGFICRKSH